MLLISTHFSVRQNLKKDLEKVVLCYFGIIHLLQERKISPETILVPYFKSIVIYTSCGPIKDSAVCEVGWRLLIMPYKEPQRAASTVCQKMLRCTWVQALSIQKGLVLFESNVQNRELQDFRKDSFSLFWTIRLHLKLRCIAWNWLWTSRV